MARGRARAGVVAVLAVGGLVGAWQASSTYAAFSDSVTVLGAVVAGEWESPPPIPPECAHLELGGEVIVGTEGPDVLVGTNKGDLILGLGGNDVIQGGNGSDCILGGDGSDTLGGDRQYENGEDVILGGAGDDLISGGNGRDLVHGGPGDDLLDGRNGKDLLYAGAGSDTLLGDNGTDLLDGGRAEVMPDTEVDDCSGGRGPEVYVGCEVVDGTPVGGGAP